MANKIEYMQTPTNTYLHFVPFKNLVNWSVQYMLNTNFSYVDKYELVEIGTFLNRNKTPIDIEDNKEYKRITIKINNRGVFLRDIEKGINIGTKKQFIVSEGQFLLSKIDARNGAFGVVSQELEGAIVTNDFPVYSINTNVVLPQFLQLITTTKEFVKFAQSCSSGTTNRQRMDINKFITQKIPLPSLSEQTRIVKNYNSKLLQAEAQENQANELEVEIQTYLFDILGIKINNKHIQSQKLFFINYTSIKEWGLDKIFGRNKYLSTKYDIHSFSENPSLSKEILRGKSPKYKNESTQIILNQKCNRWNEIDLTHAKTVDERWIKTLNQNHFTQIGDIIINSTGEGTIGRATTIIENYSNYMYDSHILLLRVNKELIHPIFFTLLFNSSYGQEQVNSIKSAQSTKQTELGIGNLQKIKFPLPPLSIQTEIANYIQKKNEQIKLLRQSAENNRRKGTIEFEKEIFN